MFSFIKHRLQMAPNVIDHGLWGPSTRPTTSLWRPWMVDFPCHRRTRRIRSSDQQRSPNVWRSGLSLITDTFQLILHAFLWFIVLLNMWNSTVPPSKVCNFFYSVYYCIHRYARVIILFESQRISWLIYCSLTWADIVAYFYFE